MHIKQAYQRRQKQKKLHPRSSLQIDRTNLIGSIYTGQVNFPKDQSFFSQYKVRDEVRQAKDYIKTLKDGDIMELRPKPWNVSVAAPRRFDDFEKEESLKSKLIKIKLGFCDYKQIKNTSNKIYQGTQLRDDYTGWNVSTYFDKKQKHSGQQMTNLNAIENSIKYNSSNLSNYKTLSDRYRLSVSLRKQQQLKNSQLLQDLKSSYLFTNPNSSPEKTSASVFKMFDSVQRQKLKLSSISQSDTQDSFNSFRAKLSPVQKSKIKYKYFHTGSWQKSLRPNKNEDEVYNSDSDAQQIKKEDIGFCWSCCMSNRKQSKGCSYKVQDGNKMNLASFDHA